MPVYALVSTFMHPSLGLAVPVVLCHTIHQHDCDRHPRNPRRRKPERMRQPARCLGYYPVPSMDESCGLNLAREFVQPTSHQTRETPISGLNQTCSLVWHTGQVAVIGWPDLYSEMATLVASSCVFCIWLSMMSS